MAEPSISVTNNREASRYESRVDGHLSVITYEARHDGSVALLHTEVAPELSGRGIGAAMVRAALEDARREGLKVVPVCSYVTSFLERHPEYDDVLA